MSVDKKNVIENQVVTLLDRLKDCSSEYIEIVSKEITRLVPMLSDAAGEIPDVINVALEEEQQPEKRNGFEKMKWAKEFIESRHDDIRIDISSFGTLLICQDDDARVFLSVNTSKNKSENYKIRFNVTTVEYSNMLSDELYSIIETYQYMADTLKELEKEPLILTKEEMKQWEEYLHENS